MSFGLFEINICSSKYATIVSFLNGKTAQFTNLNRCSQIGTMLAKLHIATFVFWGPSRATVSRNKTINVHTQVGIKFAIFPKFNLVRIKLISTNYLSMFIFTEFNRSLQIPPNVPRQIKKKKLHTSESDEIKALRSGNHNPMNYDVITDPYHGIHAGRSWYIKFSKYY